MPTYTLLQDGSHYNDFEDVHSATVLAEQLLGVVPEGAETTFTVENEDGYLLAAITNRRILGVFKKQRYDARDNVEEVGTEEFDATDYILLMNPKMVRTLKDHDQSTDFIGEAHVSWDGPHDVELIDSLIEFFGVTSADEITEEALEYAKNRLNPQPATEHTVTLSIKLKVRVAPGADITELVDDLDYSVISNTDGITIYSSEIVDSEQS